MNTIIQTPTNKLEESLNFYTRLEFRILSEKNPVLLTDGKFVLEINDDRFARAGLKLYKDSWSDEANELESITSVIKNDNGYLLSDPSGTWIYLIEGMSPFRGDMNGTGPSVLGNFVGLSLESVSIEVAFEIWRILNFKKIMGDVNQGWVSLMNEDNIGVSLMKPNTCPHLFFNPSLTYFNGGQNLPVIEKIRSLNIPITEEITAFSEDGIVDNIIIRDPGGFGFFVFND